MENRILIKGRQEFMGKELPVISGGFGEGRKCICDKTVAEIHNQPVPEIRRRINYNISRFRENIDFIDIKKSMGDSHTLEFTLELGYTKSAITQAEHIYLLSERGYARLIKIMDTDLAWEIHDRLVDEYFAMRDEIIPEITYSHDFDTNHAGSRNMANRIITDWAFDQFCQRNSGTRKNARKIREGNSSE